MLTYRERQQQREAKVAGDGATFRGLLWDLAGLLGADETLESHGTNRAYYRPALRPGEPEDAYVVLIDLGSIGANTMVDVGLRYASTSSKERTGIKKATAAGLLKDARLVVARARAAAQATRERQQAAADAKQAAEHALGFSLGSGYSFDLVGTGFDALRAWRTPTGQLMLTAEIKAALTVDQVLRIQAILREGK